MSTRSKILKNSRKRALPLMYHSEQLIIKPDTESMKQQENDVTNQSHFHSTNLQ